MLTVSVGVLYISHTEKDNPARESLLVLCDAFLILSTSPLTTNADSSNVFNRLRLLHLTIHRPLLA